MMLSSLISLGCILTQDLRPQVQQFLEQPALSIDGTSISWGEFGAWLVERQGEGLARAFANHCLLEERLGEMDLLPDREQLESLLDAEIDLRIAGAFAGRRDLWLAEFEAHHSSPELWRVRRSAERWDELLLETWVKSQRQEDEVALRQLWQARYGPEGRSQRVRALRLRHSLESIPGEDGPSRLQRERRLQAELVQRLQGVRERLLAGEDWNALAQEIQAEPDAAQARGVWAQALRWNEWPSAVTQALGQLALGEYSLPLYGQGGYQLFQPLAFEQTDFSSVRSELWEEYQARPLEAHEAKDALQNLQASAPIQFTEALVRSSIDHGEIVLRVGERELTRGAFVRWLAPRLLEIMAPLFVERFLVQREASRAGLSLTKAEIEGYVERQVTALVEREHAGDLAAWREVLSQKGLQEASIRRTLAMRGSVDLLAEKLLRKEQMVSEADVQALYHERYGPDGRLLDLRVLIKIFDAADGQNASDAKQRALNRAQWEESTRAAFAEVRRRVLEHGEDFGACAQSLSEDAESAARGGRFTANFPWHRLTKEARAGLRKLQPGEVSPPLVSGDEYWLVECVRAESVPLASVADSLRSELAQRPRSSSEITRLLQSLMAEATYELHLDALLE